MTDNRLQAIAKVLNKKYCTPAPDYKLMVWPSWLRASLIGLLEKHNLANHKTYPNLYSHTDVFIHEVK